MPLWLALIISSLCITMQNPIAPLAVLDNWNLFTNFDPTFPEFSENVWSRVYAAGECNWSSWMTWRDSKIFTIDVSGRTRTLDEFQKYYYAISLSCTGKGIPGNEPAVESDTTIIIYLNNDAYTSELLSYNKTWSSDQSSGETDLSWKWTDFGIRFNLSCWAYAYGVGAPECSTSMDFTIWKITFLSSYSVENTKEKLDALSRNPINYESDYSGSLEDERNKTAIRKLIDNMLESCFDPDYDLWKPYINSVIISDKHHGADIQIVKINKNESPLTLFAHIPINVTLSNDYWAKSLSQRLTIVPGKIVDPLDSTNKMIDDTPIQLAPDSVSPSNGGILKYHTTAHLEFDAENTKEWLEINNHPIQVLNNHFNFELIDTRSKPDDAAIDYNVKLYRENDDGSVDNYQVTYKIANFIPILNNRWYGWNPNFNPDQKLLITEFLENGKPNPDYDPEVNPDTGTKTQILWINRKSTYPFALDPINRDGAKIKDPSEFDLGYISEGSVSGMGIKQEFKTDPAFTIKREGVDNKLNPFENPDSTSDLQEITPDNEHSYWSNEGFWHYILETDDKLAFEKYILIGDNYKNQYTRFLDVINELYPNQNLIVDFWSTIHGQHLKNYLTKIKNFNSKDIQKLTFEQTQSYWKEYTSEIAEENIVPPDPIDLKDISGNWPALKLNDGDLNQIIDHLTEYVQKILNQKVKGTSLNTDYRIVDAANINVVSHPNQLLNLLNNNQEVQTDSLIIKSNSVSNLITGNAKLIIMNSQKYNPNLADDLNNLVISGYRYNFTKFSVEKLKSWLITNVENYVQKLINERKFKIAIEFNKDYGLNTNGIPDPDHNTNHNTPTIWDDNSLNQFLHPTNNISNLTVTVYADNLSINTTGSTTFTIMNDVNFPPVPPDPPLPPNPVDHQEKSSLVWIIPVVIVLVAIFTIGGYVIYNRIKRKIK